MEEELQHARQRLTMMIKNENDSTPNQVPPLTEPSPIVPDHESNEAVLQAPETPKYKEDDISIADQ